MLRGRTRKRPHTKAAAPPSGRKSIFPDLNTVDLAFPALVPRSRRVGGIGLVPAGDGEPAPNESNSPHIIASAIVSLGGMKSEMND